MMLASFQQRDERGGEGRETFSHQVMTTAATAPRVASVLPAHHMFWPPSTNNGLADDLLT